MENQGKDKKKKKEKKDEEEEEYDEEEDDPNYVMIPIAKFYLSIRKPGFFDYSNALTLIFVNITNVFYSIMKK